MITRNVIEVKCDHRSKFSNLSNWKEEAWKKSGLQRDSNPWPPRYRCDALPTELWSHTLGARSICWVHIFPCSEVMWSIYEIIHICTAVVDEVKCDHRSKFSNLSNWKEEAWKKSGLQRDSNPWPPRYRCDALPTELWSHTLGPRGGHGFESRWSPDFFQASSFQLLKLENLLRWSHFTSSTTAVQIWIISYILHKKCYSFPPLNQPLNVLFLKLGLTTLVKRAKISNSSIKALLQRLVAYPATGKINSSR